MSSSSSARRPFADISNLTGARSQPGYLSNLNKLRAVNTSFHPEIEALAHASGLGESYIKVSDASFMAIGQHLATRLDPLLRSIELEHPHLPLRPGQPLDPVLKRWISKYAKSATKLHKVTGRDLQFALSNLLAALGLAGVDPGCGGLVLMTDGYEALAEPGVYAETMLSRTPLPVEPGQDLQIPLIEGLIAYTGAATAAEALGVAEEDLSEEFHQLTHEANSQAALSSHYISNISRHLLGFHHGPMWNLGTTPMTLIGSLVYKHGLSAALVHMGY